MKQFTWLPRDFSNYIGSNWGVVLGNYLIIAFFTLTLATCHSYDGAWFGSDVTTCV